MLGKEVMVILAGYALGCFAAGYYLVHWRTGQDIRTIGSREYLRDLPAWPAIAGDG